MYPLGLYYYQSCGVLLRNKTEYLAIMLKMYGLNTNRKSVMINEAVVPWKGLGLTCDHLTASIDLKDKLALQSIRRIVTIRVISWRLY